jgi:hypothetical protein
MLNKVSSEGEEFIEMYLEDQGIKYKREVEISKLEGDYKAYRVADFYLPQYKVYMEFFGKWNTQEGRRNYLEKKEIYEKNNIPCVYIYPDNLGILEYIFRKRLKEELKKYPDLSFQLFRFKFWRFNKANQTLWAVFLSIVLLSVICENIMSGQLRMTWISETVFIVLFFIAIISAIVGIKTIFLKK